MSFVCKWSRLVTELNLPCTHRMSCWPLCPVPRVSIDLRPEQVLFPALPDPPTHRPHTLSLPPEKPQALSDLFVSNTETTCLSPPRKKPHGKNIKLTFTVFHSSLVLSETDKNMRSHPTIPSRSPPPRRAIQRATPPTFGAGGSLFASRPKIAI